MRPNRALLPIAMACLLLAASQAASAASPSRRPAPREQVAALTEAGKLAQGLGEYAFALQLFQHAHALTLRDDLLFRIAETYRARHALALAPGDRLQALAHYQRYLDLAPSGARRVECERAIAALAAEDEELRTPLVRESRRTGVVVSSPALGAVARIDGGRPRKLPLLLTVAPGKHRVVVSAPGYRDGTRTVVLRRRVVQPLVVRLDPKPAKLAIQAPDGAAVHVDGKLVGTAPLERPVEVEPGRRLVAVTDSGARPHAEEIVVERGKTSEITVELETTDQRVAAYALLGTGAASIAAGIVFGVLSVVEHREARDILADFDETLPNLQLQRDYDAAIAARDDYRIASGVGGGVGLALFVVGGALYVLDQPAVPNDDPSKAGVDVSVLPMVGPGFNGGALIVGF